MSNGYFWERGSCTHCMWPHHQRYDYSERRTLFRRRLKRAAFSVVVCCNCGKRTTVDAE